MPPAISDNETSDVDVDAPTRALKSSAKSSSKKATREKKPVTYQPDYPELDDDDEELVNQVNGDIAAEAEDEDDDDDDDDDGSEEVEEYIVEKIISHKNTKTQDGPLFKVKWEGYDSPSDETWEPEANLIENASVILEEYLESVSGRENLVQSSRKAPQGKKRGRPSTGAGTPTAGKRAKRSGEESNTPLSAKSVTWKPPAGSWEDHIAQLDACEDEETGKLMVYLTWKNGHKTQHETNVIYSRCPQKMLQFYERHVRIIKRDADANSVTTPGKMSV
ncbi:hypothetical protein B0T17DRAFT_633431 [Bombardia bombarda]|uniref:Chromo domain-containing protein n=1 Tax=Bombardia bombarda TaxID=252184 RepID=A0AA40C843_9PEZI|nr:hypothetical protein B0T17DRAFT_633431 [Bombardia bombarda]